LEGNNVAPAATLMLEKHRFSVNRIREEFAVPAGRTFLTSLLLIRSSDRFQLQRFLFGRLLKTVPCYVVNTGAGSQESIREKIGELVAPGT